MNAKEFGDYLAEFAAMVTVLTLTAIIFLVALSVIPEARLESVNATWFGLYSFIVLMSATKLYGRATLNAVKEATKYVAFSNIYKREVEERDSNGAERTKEEIVVEPPDEKKSK